MFTSLLILVGGVWGIFGSIALWLDMKLDLLPRPQTTKLWKKFVFWSVVVLLSTGPIGLAMWGSLVLVWWPIKRCKEIVKVSWGQRPNLYMWLSHICSDNVPSKEL